MSVLTNYQLFAKTYAGRVKSPFQNPSGTALQAEVMDIQDPGHIVIISVHQTHRKWACNTWLLRRGEQEASRILPEKLIAYRTIAKKTPRSLLLTQELFRYEMATGRTMCMVGPFRLWHAEITRQIYDLRAKERLTS